MTTAATIEAAILARVIGTTPQERPGQPFSAAPTHADLAEQANPPPRATQVYAAAVLGIGDYESPRYQIRQEFVVAVAYHLPPDSPSWADVWRQMASDAAEIADRIARPGWLPLAVDLDTPPIWAPPPRNAAGNVVSLIKIVLIYMPGA